MVDLSHGSRFVTLSMMQTSIKASVTRNLQYIHLVSNSGTTLPTDLWVPSTYKVKPQMSWLYAAGLFKNFKNNMFETSLEVYYKDMQNQIEYKEGYTPIHWMTQKILLRLEEAGVMVQNFLSIKSKAGLPVGSVIH